MRFLPAEIMFAVCLMQLGCQQERSTADADVPSSTLLAPHAISAPDPQAKTKDPPARSWPLDRLDRNQLTAIEREELFPEIVAVLRGKSGTILDCAFSPDGTRLATGNQEGALGLWDLTGPAPKEIVLVKVDEGGPVKRVAFSLDSKHLVSLNGGKVAQLWEVSSAGLKSVGKRALRGADQVAFHPDGKRLMVGGENVGSLLELTPTGFSEPMGTFVGANRGFAFTGGGSRFLAAHFDQARNGKLYASDVMFWRIADPPLEETRIRQEHTVRCLALSSDGKWLATGTVDQKVRLWDVTAAQPASTKSFNLPTWPREVFFASNNDYLVAFTGAADIVLLDIAAGKEVKSWRWAPRRGSLFGVGSMYPSFSTAAMASDGKHVAFSNHTPSVAIMRLPVAR